MTFRVHYNIKNIAFTEITAVLIFFTVIQNSYDEVSEYSKKKTNLKYLQKIKY